MFFSIGLLLGHCLWRNDAQRGAHRASVASTPSIARLHAMAAEAFIMHCNSVTQRLTLLQARHCVAVCTSSEKGDMSGTSRWKNLQ